MTSEEKELRNELMAKLTATLVGDDVEINHFEIEDHTDTNIKNDFKDHSGRITIWYTNCMKASNLVND